MSLPHSADSRWYRIALFMALVAMYLLLVGPLFSQLQAAHQPHHADQNAAFCGTLPKHPSSPDSLAHWHHQCEYCVVWQHFPSTHTHLPAIGLRAFIAHTLRPKALMQGIAALPNYPHALTRAPPLLSAIQHPAPLSQPRHPYGDQGYY